LWPNCLASIVFLLWGFAYGFLDVLNAHFRMAVGHSRRTSFQLHAAQFCGYALAPMLVGLPVLKRAGFRWTLITGLSVYACGTLIFWPSAVLTSLPAYFISNFFVGSGLAVLDTSINLFVSLCGPMENAEVRLNIARGVQAVGGLASYLLAQRVLFLNVDNAPSLIRVQWTYLGLALFSIFLAVICYHLPIPEAPDEELKELAHSREVDYSARVCGLRVVWMTLMLGAFSQFCYVGAQECLQTKFQTFVTANEPK
jgi:fucose permease